MESQLYISDFLNRGTKSSGFAEAVLDKTL
jgi:hypothetical protein